MNGDRALVATMSVAVANAAADLPAPPHIILCPPFPYLPALQPVVSGPIALGAQDVAPQDSGAHTGDIAAPMLAELGVSYVIVGHSERRANHGEGDALVALKAAAAHRAGLTSIICVGETVAERSGGQGLNVVATQIRASLPPSATPENTIIAYEPVWAIGTGQAATVADIAAMHAHIARTLHEELAISSKLRIVYGGSVKAENASALLQTPGVDGVLVGGAALDPTSFAAIIRAAGT